MLSYVYVANVGPAGHAMHLYVKGVHVFSFIPRLCEYKAYSYRVAAAYIKSTNS